MRVTIRQTVHLGAQVLNQGVVVDLPDEVARLMIKEGTAAPVRKGPGARGRAPAKSAEAASDGATDTGGGE